MDKPALCVFGEVLFDCFPDGRQMLGGAPFNVAWHLQAFNVQPRFISAVGADVEGERIRTSMAEWGMLTTCLQTDFDHPTGHVEVSLLEGEPSYDIVSDVAYDFVRTPSQHEACELLYHGTLALRQPVSAATLNALKSAKPDLVFLDVNLRSPWWSREQTLALVAGADWVKLNRDELTLLSDVDHARARPVADLAQELMARHVLSGLLVTLGSEGALGFSGDNPPVQVVPTAALEVVDTVGAGDAFAAVTILGIIHGWPLDKTLERAQSFASKIVGQRGATAASPELYAPFVDQWGLAD